MRRNVLAMSLRAGKLRAHIASGLSIVDICAVLYGSVMRIDPSNPFWNLRDRFLLSKGHGSLGFYTALAEAGFLTQQELELFELSEGILPVHPAMNIEKGIEISSGSLGLGLSLGVGIALAGRKSDLNYRTYVLMGDGECNEGSVWEAATAAAHFRLSNLTAIVDCNGLQSDGPCNAVMNMHSLEEKWRSFGWEIRSVDGHDIAALCEAFTASQVTDKPMAVVASTVKGKGISFMENNNEWHHNALSAEQYDAAIQELAA
jgi:transketolase